MPDLTWFESNWQGLAVAAGCLSVPMLWILTFYTVRGHIHNVRAGIQSLESVGRTQARMRSTPAARVERREVVMLESPFDLKINERIEGGRLERWTPLRGWHPVKALEDRQR